MRVLLACVLFAGCVGEVEPDPNDDLGSDELGPDDAIAAKRQTVIADVDAGGGVYLANKPGGYYMGRLFVGEHFDRHGAWYTSPENNSSYAFAYAMGDIGACLWLGPSRGRSDFTANRWASSGGATQGARCTEAVKDWLRDDPNIGSHFNCPEPSAASNGTEKVLLQDAFFYRNITWSGGAMGYDGGEPRDFVTIVPKGTSVWYRYTTRDGQHVIVFVPGAGWGFMPSGVIDRSRTNAWSKPDAPGTQIPC